LRFDLSLGDEDLGQVSLLRATSFSTREARIASRLIEMLRYPLDNALTHHAALMQSMTDGASGLLNQKALEQELPREMRLARRAEQPLSMMIIAVDYFESITEHHGASVANEAWDAVAAALRHQLRSSDKLFRSNNDQFVALLSFTDIEDALLVTHRLQQSVALSVGEDNISFVLTASAGITELDSKDDPDRFLKRAHKALGKARRHGRNQVKSIAVGSPVGNGFDPSIA